MTLLPGPQYLIRLKIILTEMTDYAYPTLVTGLVSMKSNESSTNRTHTCMVWGRIARYWSM